MLPSVTDRRTYGAKTKPIDISRHLNWPRQVPKEEWWQKTSDGVRNYPKGQQVSWGIPFKMSDGTGPQVIMIGKGKKDVTIDVNGTADYICILHEYVEMAKDVQSLPREGLVVAEYELVYSDGGRHIQPIRGRFEIEMKESPGPAWLALPFNKWEAMDPVQAPEKATRDWWGKAQTGLADGNGVPLCYAMPNPHPEKKIASVTMRGFMESPVFVAGITLYSGSSHPLRHLPRRTYRVKTNSGKSLIDKAEIDLGIIARVEHTAGPRDKKWIDAPETGPSIVKETKNEGEDVLQITGAPDATVSVTMKGQKKPVKFSLGEAFDKGRSKSRGNALEVLDKSHKWLQVRIIDESTGKPTPARIHFSGLRGEYIAPYGHHQQINNQWFEDYGADVMAVDRSFAYVDGDFTTDMPVGDVFVEICKGYEYEPIRTKVNIKPDQKTLELRISRWKDIRSDGWVTADTHVHFISPHTAWLEAQAEGVNVVNLLASQWGRLFTNVGDYIGRVGINENDTIVYVGTENRHHMLGHMSMLGTKGKPIYPMCCGGPTESFIGDPDFMALAEWALENKRKGGVVIRPHFPYCGCSEDPVPIIKGLVDALEMHPSDGFPVQEWYRYLNCGYRVACCGGTDKMSAHMVLGWLRTYAHVDPNKPFTYDRWAEAVRAGKTFASSGPLISFSVDGRQIGDTIKMTAKGGTVEVEALAESIWPLGKLEIVRNGQVVASAKVGKNDRILHLSEKIRVDGSGWLAARCIGKDGHPVGYSAAHTSPVYISCGDRRAFDGPAAEHMLGLVEGSIEYVNTLASNYDESSRKRMVKLFNEVRQELKGRLVVEAKHTHHHGDGMYHTHGRKVEHHH